MLFSCFFLFFTFGIKSPSTSVVAVDASMLCCCEVPEMFCGLDLTFTQLSISVVAIDNNN